MDIGVVALNQEESCNMIEHFQSYHNSFDNKLKGANMAALNECLQVFILQK